MPVLPLPGLALSGAPLEGVAALGLPVAHGVGVREELPLPPVLALAAGGAAVLVSFAAVRLLRAPGPVPALPGRPVPHALEALVDDRRLRAALRAAVLAATVVVLAAALAGPADPTDNLAPWALHVTFWVGLVPASLLLGPVWRAVSPLRTLHDLLRPLVGPPRSPGAGRGSGLWPAAASLSAYTWVELCAPDGDEPRVVGAFLVAYAAVHLAVALRVGEQWLARGDGFEVWSSLLARLAPVGRRSDGRLALRSPLAAAAAAPAVPGLVAVVAVLVGSTAFDGVTRTGWWQRGPGAEGGWLPPTAGLAGCVLAVAALYVGATRLSGALSGVRDLPARMAHSVVPIAAGYAVAHYATLLLVDGQRTWVLASDPLGRGWDLLGTASRTVDPGVLPPDAAQWVQVGAVVGAHVVGVVLAHDRWARVATGRRDTAGQLPLLLVMIGLTVTALALLTGS